MSRTTRPLQAHKESLDDAEDDSLPSSASVSSADDPETQSSDGDISSGKPGPKSFQEELQNVPFGDLAEAQESLGQNSRRINNNATHQDGTKNAMASTHLDAEKVNVLRERLAELKKAKTQRSAANTTKLSSTGAFSERASKGPKDHSRSSKHAPAEQSSRRAVSRYRPVIDIAQDPYHSRDPRFSAATTGPKQQTDERARKNYGFMAEYRSSELVGLKDALAEIKRKKNKRKSKTLNEEEEYEVEELKRNINSIENKMKSEAAKEREREIARSHKKEERQKIKEGKTPYYLKKSELRERSEKQRFEGMKAKEREKVMDRRRKKQSQREKRAMPNNRRVPSG